MPKLPNIAAREASRKRTPEEEAEIVAMYLAHRASEAGTFAAVARRYFDAHEDEKRKFVEWYEAEP
jgi:hypothetical protein